MKYLNAAPFSTPSATDAYRDGWDQVFGMATPAEAPIRTYLGNMTWATFDGRCVTLTWELGDEIISAFQMGGAVFRGLDDAFGDRLRAVRS